VHLLFHQVTSLSFGVVGDERREDRTSGSRLYPTNFVFVNDGRDVSMVVIVGERFRDTVTTHLLL
jgi:hypothetical protein